MVSKNQIKLINSLHQKKYRNTNKLFIVEGEKGIRELIGSSMKLYKLYTTEKGLFEVPETHETEIDAATLKKISALKTPNKALALFYIPESKPLVYNEFSVVLDDIRDPGNLGTIIRLCDWFGVSQLICSLNTVDCYNPKVVQATMGSLSRVNIHYTDPHYFINKTELPVYGAVMNGKNIYEQILEQPSVLIMGNEANGISNALLKAVNKKITIPRFGRLKQTESLNVATATAILLSEFKRR